MSFLYLSFCGVTVDDDSFVLEDDFYLFAYFKFKKWCEHCKPSSF